MNRLTSIRYDESKGMREHILIMTNFIAQVENVNLSVSDRYLIQFILNSLPPDIGPLKVACRTIGTLNCGNETN